MSTTPKLRHLTQKRLKEIAEITAGHIHRHYGAGAHNRSYIYKVLRQVQRGTIIAKNA